MSISFSKTQTAAGSYHNEETVYSQWDELYSHGLYHLYGRAYCTVGYTGGGIYSVGPIYFQVKSANSNYSFVINITSTSQSSISGFKSSSFSSTSFPSGRSISNVGNSNVTAVKFGSGNSSVDTSTIAWSSWKSASVVVKANMTVSNYSSSSSPFAADISATISLSYLAYGSKCTLTYYRDDGSQYGSYITRPYADTVTIQSGYTKSGYTDTGSGTYTISYNTNGGIAVSSRSLNWSYSQPITYSFHDWGGYTPGSTYTFLDETKSLKASFVIESGTRTWRYPTLGSAATVYTNKKGYKKTNVWYYSNDVVANSSDTITSSQTLHCTWEPQVYKVSFNLNGGKMPEDFGKPSDYTFEKTYGVSQQLPQWEPTRVGYTFAGWSNADGSISPQGALANMDDRIYNSLYTEYTTGPVVLYAKWNLNPNTMIFNYYIINSQGVEIAYIGNNADRETYNVTQTKYQKYSPSHASEMTGDYVFLGWCDEKPSNWDNSEYENRGYHGIYTLPTDAPASELPVEVDISRLNKLEDWGGAPEQYYGIWTKTGKYIMVNNSYKKVNTAYVKIAGSWKPVTDIWVKTNNTWKHEI